MIVFPPFLYWPSPAYGTYLPCLQGDRILLARWQEPACL